MLLFQQSSNICDTCKCSWEEQNRLHSFCKSVEYDSWWQRLILCHYRCAFSLCKKLGEDKQYSGIRRTDFRDLHRFLVPPQVEGTGNDGCRYGYGFWYQLPSKKNFEAKQSRTDWVMVKNIVSVVTQSFLDRFGCSRARFDRKTRGIMGKTPHRYGYGYSARYPQVTRAYP